MGEGSNPRSEDEARWSEWMARAQEGDRGAYEKLMTDLASAVEAYVRRRFGDAGASDFFEECVQESLIAIHQARHTYDPRRSFRPWFFTIVPGRLSCATFNASIFKRRVDWSRNRKV